MHLPDGILSGHAEAVAAVAAAGGLGVAAHVARREVSGVPAGRVAAVGALVFAGQMVNVPVASGTSGHLLGAALAVALLGPGLGAITVAAVVAVQALAFADGGATSLGLNVVNMALLPALVAGLVLRHRSVESTPSTPRVALAAGLGTLAAAAAFSAEYALSALGGDPASTVVPQMLAVHVPIALVEVALTLAAIAAVRALDARPALVGGGALAVAVLVAPWASAHPDGLERVAIDRGFASLGGAHPLAGSPLADYSLAGVDHALVAVGLAGAVGVALTAVVLRAVEHLALARSRVR